MRVATIILALALCGCATGGAHRVQAPAFAAALAGEWDNAAQASLPASVPLTRLTLTPIAPSEVQAVWRGGAGPERRALWRFVGGKLDLGGPCALTVQPTSDKSFDAEVRASDCTDETGAAYEAHVTLASFGIIYSERRMTPDQDPFAMPTQPLDLRRR